MRAACMIQRREIAISIVLSVITCGIYGIYWFIKLNDEINYVADDRMATTGGMAFLFSILSCGIYLFYWMYKMGEKLDGIYINKGWPAQSRGIIYLILSFFGLSIVSYALMQDSVNKAIAA